MLRQDLERASLGLRASQHATRPRPRPPEDGSVLRVPFRSQTQARHKARRLPRSLPSSLKIVNASSSGAKVKLGKKQERLLCGDHVRDSILKMSVFSEVLKIVFSEPPSSPGCILATIVHHDTTGHCVGICRIASPNSGWTMQRCQGGRTFADIAFCNGELYGLVANGSELVKFEIAVNDDDGAPVVTIAQRQLTMMKSITCVNSSQEEDTMSYIFDLHGKLAMARRAQWSLNLEPFFKVFELVDIHANHKCQWAEVTNLGDNALFLGRIFSRAVPMQANRQGGVERNTIYFFNHRSYSRPELAVFCALWNEYGGKTYYIEDDQKNDIAGHQVKRIRSVGYFTTATTTNQDDGAVWVLPQGI